MNSVSKIYEKYKKITHFWKAAHESKKSNFLTHKVAKETYELLLNPEVKVMMCFIKSFGECYWNPLHNWARRKGANPPKEGHVSNEVTIRVFNVARQLSSLKELKWLDVEHFTEYKQFVEKLNEKQLTALHQLFDDSATECIEIAFRESCFGRWTIKTLAFGIIIENKRSAQMLIIFYCTRQKQAPTLFFRRRNQREEWNW